MVSALVGQATLRNSTLTSCRNSRGPVLRLAGGGVSGRACSRRRETGAPSAPICPCRCSSRFCSRFMLTCVAFLHGVGEQGRRDSNPQPPVLETGALPIEL